MKKKLSVREIIDELDPDLIKCSVCYMYHNIKESKDIYAEMFHIPRICPFCTREINDSSHKFDTIAKIRQGII